MLGENEFLKINAEGDGLMFTLGIYGRDFQMRIGAQVWVPEGIWLGATRDGEFARGIEFTIEALRMALKNEEEKQNEREIN